MPYLTFSKAYVGNGDFLPKPNPLVKAYGKEKIHELRTLDRYYYTSLSEKDVQKRNKDQVVTKYIQDKKEKSTSRPAGQPTLQQPAAKPAAQPAARTAAQPAVDHVEKPGEDEMGLILQVDQLWIWVIDGGKIEIIELMAY